MTDVEKKMKNMISERLSVDGEKIKMTDRLVEDLGADSLDLVELIMGIEEDFGVEIPDEAAEKIRTVQDALDYVMQRI